MHYKLGLRCYFGCSCIVCTRVKLNIEADNYKVDDIVRIEAGGWGTQ